MLRHLLIFTSFIFALTSCKAPNQQFDGHAVHDITLAVNYLPTDFADALGNDPDYPKGLTLIFGSSCSGDLDCDEDDSLSIGYQYERVTISFANYQAVSVSGDTTGFQDLFDVLALAARRVTRVDLFAVPAIASDSLLVNTRRRRVDPNRRQVCVGPSLRDCLFY